MHHLAEMAEVIRLHPIPKLQLNGVDDRLIIEGGRPLRGGTVDGRGDHRIVMAAAIAATVAEGPVRITDAEAVAKSYPDFFRDFGKLGGRVYVEQPGR